MNPDVLQTVILVVILAGAAIYLVRRVQRTVVAARKPADSGCSSGCGCSETR